jgi:hypothetical protein
MSKFLTFKEFINEDKNELLKESSSFLNFDEFLFEKTFNKDVESSHLVSIDYDDDKEQLEVSFKNGSIYRYYQVPKSVWRNFTLEHNILQKIGKGIVKGAKKLFGKDVEDGTFGTRFWALIRRGGYRYKKIS